MVELGFTIWSTASFIGIFHVIWAMPQLLQCNLYYADTLTLAASSLDNLKKTALKIKPRLHLTALVFDTGVLREMQSSHLKKCNIELWAHNRQYGCKRGDLLEIICGEAMRQWLQHLPSIPEFIIRVEDNDAAFNKDWWTTEITKNLPALKDTLTVYVHVTEIKNLWTEDLPAEAASSINTENNMHINSELDELSGFPEDPYPGIDGSNLEDNTVTEALGALQVIE
ncbi:hypothetical protein VTO73DRAFT_6690 [Trametes versicolor]